MQLCRRLVQCASEALAVEDVVTEHQAALIVADKLFADDEGLGKTVRTGLNSVLQLDAEYFTAAEQVLKRRLILRRSNDEDVLDATENQHR